MSFYSEEELSTLGLKSYGKNVKISRYARIYNPSSIELGNNVRIDDFCILSASSSTFVIRDYVHISAGAYLYGGAGLFIDSFSNISGGVKLYTMNDDYSGESLVGPTVPYECRNVDNRKVVIEKHCVIGCNSVILPGVIISEGVAVGSNSFVKESLPPWTIYAGIPARYIKDRSKNLLNRLDFININDVRN
jgi:acetyltransferase-like isoleucine patch superfamily enzyme